MTPEPTDKDTRETSHAQPLSKLDAPLGDNDGRKRGASSAKDTTAVTDEGGTVAAPSDAPPPDEEAPPLPTEAPPADDGWTYQWDANANTWYFYNRFTGKSQWENPRLPQAASTSYGSYDRYASSAAGPAATSGAPGTSPLPKRLHGGYNPAIHGSYDPKADYAKEAEDEEEEQTAVTAAAGGLLNPHDNNYTMAAHFNRFNGRFQQPGINAEYHNDENKSRRQMAAFFDVDAAANSHDGRSLKAERRGRTLTKKELKAYKEKRLNKKIEKRRAWLKD